MSVRVIEVHESPFAENERAAKELREELKDRKTMMINVMSSPGSGKTTLLTALINRLKGELRILDMDVDIESTLDADRVATSTGVESLQIHNGGLCHIDAEMTGKALREAGQVREAEQVRKAEQVRPCDLIFLENIGNLVCPAEFDTGAHLNMMILSVPEGDDKPLKYPLMFSVCDLIVISKTDTMEYFDFDMERAVANIKALNPNAEILKVSAKTGQGMEELAECIRNRRRNFLCEDSEPAFTFWGADTPKVKPLNNLYPGITDQYKLYEVLSGLWCAKTCACRMRHKWTPENKTLGQCSITAFLVQDIFGGVVRGILRPGGHYHCYNDIDGVRFDLTSEQFGDEVLIYGDDPIQDREVHWSQDDKKERYDYLSAALAGWCKEGE